MARSSVEPIRRPPPAVHESATGAAPQGMARPKTRRRPRCRAARPWRPPPAGGPGRCRATGPLRDGPAPRRGGALDAEPPGHGGRHALVAKFVAVQPVLGEKAGARGDRGVLEARAWSGAPRAL